MKVVPKMAPCEGCGVILPEGEGPKGRVWHGCDPSRLVKQHRGIDRLRERLNAGDNGPEALRAMILEAAALHALDGELPERVWAAVLEGTSKNAGSGENTGAEALLQEWMKGIPD